MFCSSHAPFYLKKEPKRQQLDSRLSFFSQCSCMIIYLVFCLFTFLGFFVLSGPREKSQKAGSIKTRAHLFGAAWLKGKAFVVVEVVLVYVGSLSVHEPLRRVSNMQLSFTYTSHTSLCSSPPPPLNFLHSIHESAALQPASRLHLALPPGPPPPLDPLCSSNVPVWQI